MAKSQTASVSAPVSPSTKDQLDRFARERGLKKGHIIEEALLQYMESRRQLPDEAFAPTRVVLTNDDFDKIIALIDSPPTPTDALTKLMRG